MLTNDHFHSICSFDADYPLTDLCRAAAAGGVGHLCLTDHCELVDEHGQPDDSFDWAAEDLQLEEARLAYPELDLRRGVELGQAILRPEAAERFLQEPNIDFVLGSMHLSRAGVDFYYMHFTTKEQCLSVLEEYFQVLLELSRTDYFDSLAHLTYPIRYMQYRDGVQFDLRGFDGLIDEILKTLVRRGKALELNTSILPEHDRPQPDRYILERYRQLGGDLITIGSDAHAPDRMAAGLQAGMVLLEQCGFRYLTRYRERNPQQYKLEDFL